MNSTAPRSHLAHNYHFSQDYEIKEEHQMCPVHRCNVSRVNRHPLHPQPQQQQQQQLQQKKLNPGSSVVAHGNRKCCSCCGFCVASERCERCRRKCRDCLTKFTIFFLVVPNIVFMIFGSAMIGLGVWLRSDRDWAFYLELSRGIPLPGFSVVTSIDKFPFIVIAVGICILVLSFLGCCGACAESVCFLCLYTVFLMVIVIAEVVLALLIATMREEVTLKMESTLQSQIKLDYTNFSHLAVDELDETARNHSNSKRLITAVWDELQTQYNCCGSRGPEDYVNSFWMNKSSRIGVPRVPQSCCRGALPSSEELVSPNVAPHAPKHDLHCQQLAAEFQHQPDAWKRNEEYATALKTQGCKDSLLSQLRGNIANIAYVICSTIVLQVLDFIMACYLLRLYKKRLDDLSWLDDDFD